MAAQTTLQSRVQFIVSDKSVETVRTSEHKLRKLYRVQLKVEDGEPRNHPNRWISVHGADNEDASKAKDYILALTSPERRTLVPVKELFAHAEHLLDEEIVENIERNTAAVIRSNGRDLEISGSDIAVAMAVSSLESLAHSVPVPHESNVNNHHSGGGEEEGEGRQLEGTVWQVPAVNGTGVSSRFAAGSSVCAPQMAQPAALACRSAALPPGMSSDFDKDEDIDDNALFGSKTPPVVPVSAAAPLAASYHRTPLHCSGGRCSPPSHSGKVSPQMRAPPHAATCDVDVDGPSEGICPTEKMAQRLSSTTIHSKSEPQAAGPCMTSSLADEEWKEYHRKLAMNLGYTRNEVEEGFLYVSLHAQNNKLAPSEFLAMLANMKEEKKKMEAVTVVSSSEEDSPEEKSRSRLKERRPFNLVVADRSIPASRAKSPGTPTPGLTRAEAAANEKKQEEMRRKFYTQTKQMPPQPAQTAFKQQHRSGGEPRHKSDVMLRRERRACTPEASHTAPIPGSKRKQNFSDDEHQTTVLKPYGAQGEGTGGCHSGDNHQNPSTSKASDLRFVVIDATNVAVAHSNHKCVSCRGLQIAIDYFVKRGHQVAAFMPEYMRYRYTDRPDKIPVRNPEILDKLSEENLLHFTPARRLEKRLIASYDDRYIVELAQKEDGIIVSNDQYRDLVSENPQLRKFIEERLLPFNFVNDHFMLPQDPLGRYGPRLEEFLRKTPSVAPQPQPAGAGAAGQERVKVDGPAGDSWPALVQPARTGRRQRPVNDLLPRPGSPHRPQASAQSHSRTLDKTEELFQNLKDIFSSPEQVDKIREVLANHPDETDLNRLSNYCVSALNY